jgi:hypothetical protein
MTDMIDKMRAKQRELDDLRRQARNDEDATFRTHSVAHSFSEGEESEDPAPAELRQALADMFGVSPEAYEDMDPDALRTIYAAETSETDREHVADRSPQADMRGVGGGEAGSPADRGAEGAQTPPGYGANGYPKKGRDASRKRHAASGDGRGENGYPQKGREAWRARGGDRTATDRLAENRREHSGEASGKVEKRRQRASKTDPRDLRDRDLST